MTNEHLYLIAVIAGQRVAIAAAPVESVIEIGPVQPVPRAARHVAGLAALRSRVLTVIDSVAALGLPRGPEAEIAQAIVVTIDGHLYALLVDGVEDVVGLPAEAVRPLRAPLAAGWARVVSCMVEIDGQSLPLIAPRGLVAGGEAEAA